MTPGEVRADVAAELVVAGMAAETVVTERTAPPVVVVGPGEPYVDRPVSEGVPFGHMRVNVTLLLIGGKGTNRASVDTIDTMITTAITALNRQVTEVGQPGQLNLNGHQYLGVLISMERVARIGGQ